MKLLYSLGQRFVFSIFLIYFPLLLSLDILLLICKIINYAS
jgi:hypothetical protein